MGTHQGEFLDQTQAQAAYWFTRLNSGEATAAELREFEDWRRANPEHERCYRYICYFCDASLDAPEHELRRLLPSLGQVHAPRRWRLLVGAVAAVALAGAAWFWPDSLIQDDHVRSTAQALEHRLPDGALARLEPDSEIRVRTYAHKQEVHIVRGSVFFDVQGQEQRPLEVQTGFAQAHASTAQFRVDLDNNMARFLVEFGSVEVTGGTWWRRQVRVLIPGQHVDVDRWAGMRRVQPAPISPPEAD